MRYLLSQAEAEVAQPGKALDCYLALAGQTSNVREDSGVQIPPFALLFPMEAGSFGVFGWKRAIFYDCSSVPDRDFLCDFEIRRERVCRGGGRAETIR